MQDVRLLVQRSDLALRRVRPRVQMCADQLECGRPLHQSIAKNRLATSGAPVLKQCTITRPIEVVRRL